MLQKSHFLARSLAALLLAASFAPSPAQAWPLGRLLHLHPQDVQTEDGRITVRLYNRGVLFQDVKVDGRLYTVAAHDTLSIKAPAGTPVYAASTGFGHTKGGVLFVIAPTMKNDVVQFN